MFLCWSESVGPLGARLVRVLGVRMLMSRMLLQTVLNPANVEPLAFLVGAPVHLVEAKTDLTSIRRLRHQLETAARHDALALSFPFACALLKRLAFVALLEPPPFVFWLLRRPH